MDTSLFVLLSFDVFFDTEITNHSISSIIFVFIFSFGKIFKITHKNTRHLTILSFFLPSFIFSFSSHVNLLFTTVDLSAFFPLLFQFVLYLFIYLFLTFSCQPAVTTADLTSGLLSFLFSFDVASYKSHDSFFLSFPLQVFFFFKDYNKKRWRSHLRFFLSFFLSFISFSLFFRYYVLRHAEVHTEHLCFILLTDSLLWNTARLKLTKNMNLQK